MITIRMINKSPPAPPAIAAIKIMLSSSSSNERIIIILKQSLSLQKSSLNKKEKSGMQLEAVFRGYGPC